MKIGFDGKRALQNFTGLGNYSRYILEILSKYYPADNYHVYCPKIQKNKRTEYLFNLRSLHFHQPGQSALKSFWRSFGIINDLKKDGINLYHGLSNELPFGMKKAGIKSIVTIHDLIFLRFPKYYNWLDRKIYTYKFRSACKNTDQIIAISEQTKRDIILFFGIDENRIQVIYQNCHYIFRQKISLQQKRIIADKYNLPKRFLLNVGTIESRKNLLLIVKALNQLPAEINLVVVGRQTRYTELVKDYILNKKLDDRVHFLSNIPFEDLPAIYQLAEVFIYPSRFEGFGIPIIEALHSGVPVIAAKGSCLEEAGGPDSIYIDPDSEDELVQAIQNILKDDGEKQKMIAAGSKFVGKFDDEKIAAEYMNLYQRLN